MVRFISLGSGSSGNAYYLESADTALLIDMGIGIRTCKKYFRDYGLNFGMVRALLVTHYHTDHVKAVGALSQLFHFTVCSSQLVHEGMDRNFMMSKKVPQELRYRITHHESFQVGSFTITPFPVPHDTSENNGYFITHGNIRFCLITDAGHITSEMLPYIREANYLVIEANYDKELLATGPYPPYLQKRISGGNGHLCNDITADTLSKNLSADAKHVWLCHLSEENNRPNIAKETITKALKEAGYGIEETLHVETLRRKEPSGFYLLD